MTPGVRAPKFMRMDTAFTPLPDRAVLALAGPDTLAFLERVVTCNTADWAPGEARHGALLTPQGKVIADFLALRDEAGVLLDVARGALADLQKRLTLYRLRSDVAIAPREDLTVITGKGALPENAAQAFEDPRHEGAPLRAFTSEPLAPDEAALARWQAGRIAAGLPELGEDFGAAEVFPAEINMDVTGGVDLKKGCFIGQEVVSRMHRRGNIRKRSLVLAADGAEPGAPVLAGDSEIGTVTSAAGGHALARIRIDRLAAAGEAPLTAGGRPASVTGPSTLWPPGPAASDA